MPRLSYYRPVHQATVARKQRLDARVRRPLLLLNGDDYLRPYRRIPPLQHWAETVTALATAATGILMYLQRRDQRRAAEPFVECNVRDSRQPGWASIFITVRNFHPHMLHVRELRVLAPRTAAIYHEREAFRNDGSAYDPKRVFIATSEPARLIARIDASVRPYGSEPKYSANALMSPGDVITEEFYFSARVQDRPISVKMALICEVRSRVVRQLRIPINRTITLDSASKAG